MNEGFLKLTGKWPLTQSVTKNTGQRADELISVSLSASSPFVVKTTNLATKSRMNSEVKASHLSIYKGKVFIEALAVEMIVWQCISTAR